MTIMKNSAKKLIVPLHEISSTTLRHLTLGKWRSRPRTFKSILKMSSVLFSIGFLSFTGTRAAFGQGTWVEKAPMPAPIIAASAATISGTMYVAGGNGGTPGISIIPEASLYAYNPLSDSWTNLAPMPGPRYGGSGAGVISNQLYIVGGWTTSPPLPNNNLWVYDPVANAWTAKASFPHLTASGACGVINGLLYVTSPNNGYSEPDQTELWLYNPVSNTWTAEASSPIAHVAPAAGVIGGKFYVAGGSSQGSWTAELDVYDPASNTWTTNAPMPIALAECASAVLDGKLYVIGGYNASVQAVSTVEVFDPVAGTWTTETPMPTARVGASASAVNGVIYVVGGYNGSVNVATNEAFIPSPSLGIAPAGTQEVVYWPAWATNYVLQTTTNLASPNWATVSNGTPIIGVTLTNTLPAAYFRLQLQ
jgi:N-acetylneuraminic acid mutarotase